MELVLPLASVNLVEINVEWRHNTSLYFCPGELLPVRDVRMVFAMWIFSIHETF